MKKFNILFFFWISLSCSFQSLLAQEDNTSIQENVQSAQQRPEAEIDPLSNRVFEFSLKKDLPILAGSGAMTLGGILLMESVDPLTEAQVAVLDPNNINALDRGATRQYRVNTANFSDYLLTVSAIAPFSVLASRSVRREFAPVFVMYFETAALAGGLTSISKGLFKRKRPYAYNPDALISDRLSLDARHSFFSGHVSTSASFCFLTAYMVNRYAERPGWKWAAWSGAVVIPGTIGLWRYTSGKHFPTDIIAGYLVGAGTGMLIPYLHRWKLPPDVTLNVQPVPYGLYMSLTF